MCMGSVCLISIADLPTTSPSIVLVLPCSGTPWHCMVCKDTLIYNYIYLIQSHQLWYLLGVQKNIYNILVFWIEITVLSNHWHKPNHLFFGSVWSRQLPWATPNSLQISYSIWVISHIYRLFTIVTQGRGLDQVKIWHHWATCTSIISLLWEFYDNVHLLWWWWLSLKYGTS